MVYEWITTLSAFLLCFRLMFLAHSLDLLQSLQKFFDEQGDFKSIVKPGLSCFVIREL